MKVLIPTDGSDFSRFAIETYCKALSTADDAVRVVSVVEPVSHIVGAPFGVVDDHYNSYIKKARSEAETHLDEAEAIIDGNCGVGNVETSVIIGPPARSIIEDAIEWQADLIVMGSHGRGFWKRVYLGSVSTSVVHHAPCSVLVARKADYSKI